MPKDYSRSLRVADQIQRELADLIQNEIKDPRIKQITLTAVEVTRDYSHAKVFFTTLANKEDVFLIENGLEHAKGFLRSNLSHRMKLRITPELHFVYDESVERGARLSKLIDNAVAQDTALHRTDPDSSA
ncbi:30S ribosome-binding factor RbfA [Nitrosomonas sp. JL21]|uniref:30S ribosome-binding factor RbfA n=1 Tax=Nitrosomonas sp. JL21 TaxID=153949 RepID=UPI00136D0BCD|nr:30S ribosome-binding factor RbfA [Nitrosomonas sp. JL21]MBL8498637.1 30S ribosome-binding factor RbfA [Nitrosomonas sp.]MXS79048.1 30S ribosome-binding factor RbfA [Nitrosomonas sp. JL21]